MWLREGRGHKYNTVGMYQLYKMLSVPCVFVGELLFFGVGFRPPIAVALAALLVGLALATVNDVSFRSPPHHSPTGGSRPHQNLWDGPNPLPAASSSLHLWESC